MQRFPQLTQKKQGSFVIFNPQPLVVAAPNGLNPSKIIANPSSNFFYNQFFRAACIAG